MAKNLYARKSRRQNSHKGILWIALIIALMLLVIPILWMNYPFRAGSFKKYRKTPLDEAEVRVAVHGSIPRNFVKAQIPKESSSAEKTSSVVVARIEKPQSNLKGGGTTPEIHTVPNPYADKEKARLAQKQQEEKFKKAISSEALKELENKKDSILPESNGKNQSAHPPESTQKKGMYSLLNPSRQEVSRELPKPKIPEPTGSSSHTVKQKATVSEKKTSRTKNVTFWIQVGAFSKKFNALDMIKRVKNLGYRPVLHQVHHAKYGRLYLVRIPAYGKKADARRLASTISQKLGEKAIIVRAGK